MDNGAINLKIFLKVVGRVVLCSFWGGAWGLVVGIFQGAWCGAVFALLVDPGPSNGTGVLSSLATAGLGLFYGAYLGAFIGIVSGTMAFFVLSLIMAPGESVVSCCKRLSRTSRIVTFLGAFAGGATGGVFGFAAQFISQAARNPDTVPVPIWGSCSAYAGGWFYGSVAGFFVAMILAAVMPQRLENAWLALRRRTTAHNMPQRAL